MGVSRVPFDQRSRRPALLQLQGEETKRAGDRPRARPLAGGPAGLACGRAGGSLRCVDERRGGRAVFYRDRGRAGKSPGRHRRAVPSQLRASERRCSQAGESGAPRTSPPAGQPRSCRRSCAPGRSVRRCRLARRSCGPRRRHCRSRPRRRIRAPDPPHRPRRTCKPRRSRKPSPSRMTNRRGPREAVVARRDRPRHLGRLRPQRPRKPSRPPSTRRRAPGLVPGRLPGPLPWRLRPRRPRR